MSRKTRSRTFWSQRNLPDDVWPEILSRLPVKPLLRFRCVSKRWLALIGDSNFARLHFNRLNNNSDESRLFVVEGYYGEQKFFVKSTPTFRTTATLVLESDSGPSGTPKFSENWHLSCSIDGLFMLCNYRPENPDLMVWNPSIRKALILPPCPERSTINWLEFGLGFDPLNKDYKHIRFAKSGDLRFLAVYSFRKNLWKTIELQEEIFPHWQPFFNLYTGEISLCYKGFLCALESSRLVSIDLSNEKVDTIRLPDEVVNLETNFDCMEPLLTMADGGNSIALVSTSITEGSVWILEGVGSADSNWTQRYKFSTTILRYKRNMINRLLYLKKNGELLLNMDHAITCYNFETREEKVVKKKELCLRLAWRYMESLMLL